MNNIKRFINQNSKIIWYGALIIIIFFIVTKSLNTYYEKKAEIKHAEFLKEESDKQIQNTQVTTEPEEINYSVENTTIQNTMKSFVHFCNNREIDKAYQMLTDECKNAKFEDIDYFKKYYVEEKFSINKRFKMVKWSEDGNKTTFLVKLYEDLLSTGGSEENNSEEYCTFVKNDNGIYKLNISNYIYGEEKNIAATRNGVTVKVEYVDIYESFESMKISVTNGTAKKICLNGNKYAKKIYSYDASGTAFSSINSEFDMESVIMEPNTTRTFIVKFNKVYSASNKVVGLLISDVILDYNAYLNSTNKQNYSNRISIDVPYYKNYFKAG